MAKDWIVITPSGHTAEDAEAGDGDFSYAPFTLSFVLEEASPTLPTKYSNFSFPRVPTWLRLGT